MIKDLLLVFVCLINVYLGLTIYKVYIYIMHKGALDANPLFKKTE